MILQNGRALSKKDMRRILLTCTMAFTLLPVFGGEGKAPPMNKEKSLLIDYVDPFIGTTNFGTTNPGAVCPNGMMSVVPFNVMGSADNTYDKDARWWSTPYEYTNCFFTGYSHVNLSGVGCPELGSLLLMPTTGELNVDYKEYGSKYKDEQASPGYYSNYLTKYNIKTEVSATPRTGIARFTFPRGKSHILLNLGEGLTSFTIGAPFQDLIDEGFGLLGEAIGGLLGDSVLSSFIVDGIIGGVGGVLTFLPIIIIMFLFISILEDSGYLARAAFVMDKVMHKLVGLHGKSFIPMILGFGCGVPAIMATRTMENESDRLLSMMLVPFMSCTARLPVYALLISAFFAANQGEVLFSIYLLGIVVAFVVAAILKRTMFKGMSSPFVMELPTYKVPSLKGVLLHTWDKTKGFLRKAGTIILVASIIVWVLSSVPFGVEYGSQESAIGQIGTAIAPIFAPLGFGEWQPAVAILFGLVAKEVVVSTFSSLFGVEEEGSGIEAAVHELFTPLSAYAFMAFVLLYVPCFAAIGTIKQETNGWKWPLIMSVITLATGYIVALIIYQGGSLLGFA